ncbi:MAG: DUF3822 family protein [Bacteroidales bacterium]|jgi:hypothetical protein|nr:DUF3822 family protein [Bacteroidales bacterium]
MPTIVRNTPFCLIPKELFIKEQVQEYWKILYTLPNPKNFGIDDFQSFFLIYPKIADEDSVHEIIFMYNNLQEKFPNHANSIFLNEFEHEYYLLVILNHEIAFAGYFQYAEQEDVLYHMASVSQHYFDDNYSVVYAYQQLSPKILRLLNNYFEMLPVL